MVLVGLRVVSVSQNCKKTKSRDNPIMTMIS